MPSPHNKIPENLSTQQSIDLLDELVATFGDGYSPTKTFRRVNVMLPEPVAMVLGAIAKAQLESAKAGRTEIPMRFLDSNHASNWWGAVKASRDYLLHKLRGESPGNQSDGAAS